MALGTVYYNKISIYPRLYLLKGGKRSSSSVKGSKPCAIRNTAFHSIHTSTNSKGPRTPVSEPESTYGGIPVSTKDILYGYLDLFEKPLIELEHSKAEADAERRLPAITFPPADFFVEGLRFRVWTVNPKTLNLRV